MSDISQVQSCKGLSSFKFHSIQWMLRGRHILLSASQDRALSEQRRLISTAAQINDCYKTTNIWLMDKPLQTSSSAGINWSSTNEVKKAMPIYPCWEYDFSRVHLHQWATVEITKSVNERTEQGFQKQMVSYLQSGPVHILRQFHPNSVCYNKRFIRINLLQKVTKAWTLAKCASAVWQRV